MLNVFLNGIKKNSGVQSSVPEFILFQKTFIL